MLRGSTPNIVAENVRLLMSRGHPEAHAIKKAHAHANFHAATGALTAMQRDSLPDGAFALPNRRYPIHNVKHARNALARVAQHGTPAERKAVKAAVADRYPEIEQGKD